jgi:hypothetical protein
MVLRFQVGSWLDGLAKPQYDTSFLSSALRSHHQPQQSVAAATTQVTFDTLRSKVFASKTSTQIQSAVNHA